MALLCYGLLVLAWIVDLVTPQLFIAAILFNGPIALSSLALRSRLTTNLVVVAEIANVIAGYTNGIAEKHQWAPIAVADRALLAASFVLVGALSVKAQEYAREAGASSGRMRQVEIEKALRVAIGRVRETLNLELVQRAVARESVQLLGVSKAILIAREPAFGTPLRFAYTAGAGDVAVERRSLSTEVGALVARAAASRAPIRVTPEDPLGRLTLDALGASDAWVTAIDTSGPTAYVLIELGAPEKPFSADAARVLQAFAQQAAMALEQARLFAQLGERNDEIAAQKNEFASRGEVIRDIVYALAHDLRTPLAAAHVTMNQALGGAYGALPEPYRPVLRTALAANDDQRRIVETLLLVARYEAGEISSVREPIACNDVAVGVVSELRAVAQVKGVEVRAAAGPEPLTMMGDPHETRRALTNLLANAIDATPRGGHVVVRTDRDAAGVTFAVEDDGFGVPEGRRASLFQRFGGGRPGTGSGLGLYIVRRIAEKHGGGVTYAPRTPRGSTFAMTFPAAP